jgi:copper chaperone CopZ
MKRTLTMMVVALLMSVTAMAQDWKVLVVKTTPEVQNVEMQVKVKNQLRLTTGVKKVESDFASKQVMVTYDPKKTDQKKIVAALKKNGYEATVVSDGQAPEAPAKTPVDGTSGASKQKK